MDGTFEVTGHLSRLADELGLNEDEIQTARFTQVTTKLPGRDSVRRYTVREGVDGNEVVHYPEQGSVVIKGNIVHTVYAVWEPEFPGVYQAEPQSSPIELSCVPAVVRRGLTLKDLDWL